VVVVLVDEGDADVLVRGERASAGDTRETATDGDDVGLGVLGHA